VNVSRCSGVIFPPRSARFHVASKRSSASRTSPTPMLSFFLRLIVTSDSHHVCPEILPQFPHRNESIRHFLATDVFMIAFAGFVIVAHQAFAAVAVIEPVLETVRAIRRWLRQSPNNDFDDRTVG